MLLDEVDRSAGAGAGVGVGGGASGWSRGMTRPVKVPVGSEGIGMNGSGVW
ncbi:hypothetical protein Kisp02_73400 [Kineosporia sp. NBRC 101731]|nr:hypothetical protein Kisp02_73400 [Kineosporia sp. NBRC 101731]